VFARHRAPHSSLNLENGPEDLAHRRTWRIARRG
jgi:hypothetical protein